MPLVILHHLLNVFVQLANKRGFTKKNFKEVGIRMKGLSNIIKPWNRISDLVTAIRSCVLTDKKLSSTAHRTILQTGISSVLVGS
jgi:hypothetical protein